MVHAPHSPMPQPYLVPTSPSASRSTHSIGVSDATSTERDWPFTRNVYLLMVTGSGWRARQEAGTTPRARPILPFYEEWLGAAITRLNAGSARAASSLDIRKHGRRRASRDSHRAPRASSTT